MNLESFVHISPQRLTDSVVDLFCGGGGSGAGILDACARLGRSPAGTFVNHWDKAIEIHQANHPEHRHLKEDIFLLRPEAVFPHGTNTTLLWGSPSCQQFSISRGNRPINEQGRSHADTLIDWILHLNPECVMVENVKEFLQWGRLRQRRDKKTKELKWAMEVPAKKKGKMIIKTFPKLEPDHRRQKGETEPEWELRMLTLGYDRHLEPDPEYKGEYFKAWFDKIKSLGYHAEHRILCSADYGDPTIRKRVFVQFVRANTGKRICWPYARFAKPNKHGECIHMRSHVPTTVRSWPTARKDVIDWAIKGTSVFDPNRKKLVAATFRRLAIGLVKFGLKDFIVPVDNFGGDRVRSTDEPVSVVKTEHRGEGLAVPELTPFALTSNKGFADGVEGLDKPRATATTHARGEGLAEPKPAWLIPNFGERDGQTPRTHDLDGPVPAVTGHGAGGLCEAEAFILEINQSAQSTFSSPAKTVAAPLGAVTTKANQALVEPEAFILTKQGLNPHMNVPRDLDGPLPAILTDGRQHLVELASFVMPEDQGHLGDYVMSADHPVSAVQTTAVDHVVQPYLVQMNGNSDAISQDEPVGAVTGTQKQYLAEPYTCQLRGTGTASSVDQPTHGLSAGGTHELLAEAVVMCVTDNVGQKRHQMYSVDEPARVVVAKANQALARFTLHTLEECIRKVSTTATVPSDPTSIPRSLQCAARKAPRFAIPSSSSMESSCCWTSFTGC